MSTRQLRCFVASRLGVADVDAVFDRCIRPTLKTENIVVRRVDRRNLNEDLDDQIIDLIQWCDFCIADLTYARPSVYFEAGMVTGLGKPVIYMARGDHFKDKPDDPEGNRRVHFDLQMKPIIPWTSPEAASTARRLSGRVHTVCKPITRSLEVEAEAREAVARFERDSPMDRLDRVGRRVEPLARAAGFRRHTRTDDFYVRKTPEGLQMLSDWYEMSSTKGEVKHVAAYFRRVASSLIAEQKALGVAVISHDLLIVTLRPLRPSTIHDLFPEFHVAAPSLFRSDSQPQDSDFITAVHTMCPRSYESFESDLKWHLSQVGVIGKNGEN